MNLPLSCASEPSGKGGEEHNSISKPHIILTGEKIHNCIILLNSTTVYSAIYHYYTITILYSYKGNRIHKITMGTLSGL